MGGKTCFTLVDVEGGGYDSLIDLCRLRRDIVALWSIGRVRWRTWSAGIALEGVFAFEVAMELAQVFFTVSRDFCAGDTGANLIGIMVASASLILVGGIYAGGR